MLRIIFTPIVISCSKFVLNYEKLIQEKCQTFGSLVSWEPITNHTGLNFVKEKDFSSASTHFIVANPFKMSANIMNSIAHQVPLVSIDWIKDFKEVYLNYECYYINFQGSSACWKVLCRLRGWRPNSDLSTDAKTFQVVWQVPLLFWWLQECLLFIFIFLRIQSTGEIDVVLYYDIEWNHPYG